MRRFAPAARTLAWPKRPFSSYGNVFVWISIAPMFVSRPAHWLRVEPDPIRTSCYRCCRCVPVHAAGAPKSANVMPTSTSTVGSVRSRAGAASALVTMRSRMWVRTLTEPAMGRQSCRRSIFYFFRGFSILARLDARASRPVLHHHPADLLDQLRRHQRRLIGEVAAGVVLDDIGGDDRLLDGLDQIDHLSR